MKEQRFKKVVKWADGKGFGWGLLYFILIILFFVTVHDLTLWKQLLAALFLISAMFLKDLFEFPSREVFWIKDTVKTSSEVKGK